MEALDKMQSAIEYIIESKWTNSSVDCFGNNIKMGLELDEVKFIQKLTIFIGKAQVYADKKEDENFKHSVNAFWKIFEEEFSMKDFEDFYSFYSK